MLLFQPERILEDWISPTAAKRGNEKLEGAEGSRTMQSRNNTNQQIPSRHGAPRRLVLENKTRDTGQKLITHKTMAGVGV